MAIAAPSPVVVPETTYPYLWFDYVQILAPRPNVPAPVTFSTRPYDGSAAICPPEITPPVQTQFDLWPALAQNPERATARQKLFNDFMAELLLIRAELAAQAAADVQPVPQDIPSGPGPQ